MTEALLDKTALWLAGDGPEASVVVGSQCSLLRNLVDFSFPERCSEDELHAVEKRIVGVLERVGFLESGRYRSLARLEQEEEARFLGERQLVTYRLLKSAVPLGQAQVEFHILENRSAAGATPVAGPQGAYVADDQSMSIMVNGSDHLCARTLTSGLQLQEAWARLNLVDDTLAGALDFAFDDRYGYLTSELSHVGTGLLASVILHLPALAMANRMEEVAELAKERRQVLRGLKPTVALRLWPKGEEKGGGQAGARSPSLVGVVSEALYSDLSGALFGAVDEAEGDLYLVSNRSTLGVSEEEIVFHLRHAVTDIIAREREARETLRRKDKVHLEDRVSRALGLARRARLLGFSEGLALLSSIRLGVATGLVEDCSIKHLNELLIASQNVHIKMNAGRDCDELTLNTKRADLFRTQLSQN